ncbi:MAG TPA: YARHG domain-containing protein [Desulfohalobiaceae bacterium]|nr:YARHG domain-containing protein [Desulfohalobiaceae bacterium]
MNRFTLLFFLIIALVLASNSYADFSEQAMKRYRLNSLEKDRFNNAFLILQGDISLLKYALKDYQIGQLNASQLRIARNTIFARYGYKFKRPKLFEYFSQFPWYNPSNSFDKNLLTEIDRYNINLILYFEKKYKNNPIEGIERKNVLGIWHPSPTVGSGYMERYFFNKDGTFKWSSNQMDGSNRLFEYHGRWRLKGKLVEITVSRYKWLKGGKIVEPYASYGSSFIIENGELKSINISEDPLTVRLPVEKYGLDQEVSNSFKCNRISMFISGRKFYKGPYE